MKRVICTCFGPRKLALGNCENLIRFAQKLFKLSIKIQWYLQCFLLSSQQSCFSYVYSLLLTKLEANKEWRNFLPFAVIDNVFSIFTFTIKLYLLLFIFIHWNWGCVVYELWRFYLQSSSWQSSILYFHSFWIRKGKIKPKWHHTQISRYSAIPINKNGIAKSFHFGTIMTYWAWQMTVPNSLAVFLYFWFAKHQKNGFFFVCVFNLWSDCDNLYHIFFLSFFS